MEKFYTVIAGSFVVERLTELIKPLMPKANGLIISMGVAIPFSVLYNLDVLGAIGLTTSIPFISEVLTGVLISGGAGVINAIIEFAQNLGGK